MTQPAGTTDVAAAAAAWRAAGCSVVPTRVDGTKAPASQWKRYTVELPHPTDVANWFANGHPGLGLVCGAVSGGLEMLELEGRAIEGGKLTQLLELAEAAELVDLWRRLTTGYVEWTPSGGMHLLYRLDGAPVPGNTKLAKRPARPDELTDDERQVLASRPDHVFYRTLAETRGEGGYVVVAPSHGPVHPTGQAWTVIAGQAGQLPTITAEERTELHRLVRLLDEQVEPPVVGHQADQTPRTFSAPARPAPPPGHISPGDDFEARVDWDDQALLGGVGWRVVSGRPGGYRTWRRPGKERGISATTGTDAVRDRLYVFSSSTEFETEHPYTKLGVYALLHHGGNHTAAAQELQRRGYGTQRPAQPAAVATLSVLATPGAVPGQAIAAQPLSTPVERLRAALLTSRDLDNIPEPRPLVKDVLQLDSLAWLIGAPGNGKSFVSLDIAGCVGTGEVWQGYPTVAGPVLYLIAEGATGVKQRVRAWEQSMGKEMVGVQFLPVAVQSADETEWGAFTALAAELKPSLIVIDTQARVTVGMEENSAKDMGLFVHRAEMLRVATGSCVLIIHHIGRGGEHMRGSTSMDGAATTIVKVAKSDEILTVECQKQKDAPAFDPLTLRLVPTGSSAVLAPTDGQSTPISGRPAVLRALRAWWDSHGTNLISVTTLVDSGVIAKNTFYSNRKALVAAGYLEELTSGAGGERVRYRLLRNPESHGVPSSPTGPTGPTSTESHVVPLIGIDEIAPGPHAPDQPGHPLPVVPVPAAPPPSPDHPSPQYEVLGAGVPDVGGTTGQDPKSWDPNLLGTRTGPAWQALLAALGDNWMPQLAAMEAMEAAAPIVRKTASNLIRSGAQHGHLERRPIPGIGKPREYEIRRKST